jgi:CheY-like chemotaxis protein
MCIYELTTASCADDKAIVKTDNPRLITLDDSPDWGNFVSEVAEKVGFSACAVSSHGCYARIAKTEPPDVLVLDLFMPDRDGIEMIMDIEASDDRPFILLISGQSKSFLDSAVRLGRGKGLEIIGALAKPFRLPDLKAMLQKAADLVEQKKKLGNKIRTMRSTQQTTAKPCDMVIDHDHIAKHDLQDSGGRVASERKQLIAVKQSFRQEAPRKTGNVASFPATENSLRRSIAEINAQFCLMLWDTHLATLNALSAVLGDLAEAAASLIANTAKTEAVSSWQLALRIHTQTLVENRIAIREIANSLHLPGPGWSAAESIDRISSIVSEILAAKRTNSASDAQMLASLRDLCSEKDRLKEKFAALLIAVNNALVLANDAAVSRSARTVGPR